MHPVTKALFAEIIGTTLLSSVVLLSVSHPDFAAPTPVLAAVTLAVLVFMLGKVSGGHFNPAVTVGAWSIGKIPALQAGGYIVCQFLGALVASELIQLAGISLQPLTVDSSVRTYLAEIVATAVFTFGIASVVYRRQISDLATAVIVGSSLFVGLVFSLLGSNGGLNPAVALAIQSFSVPYLVGPVIGSLIGFNVYKLLFSKVQAE